jgi:hypothetical protein
MIYATTSDGILIGLSKRNLELLQEGHPILRRVQGMPTLRIMYGDTEAAIVNMLIAEGLITPDHVIKTDRLGNLDQS